MSHTHRNPVYIGRQPIFDRDSNLAGYELLTRASGLDQHAVFDNPDEATEELLSSVLFDVGLDRMVGSHPAYINVRPSFLSHRLIAALPFDRVVLELVDVQPDDGTLARRLTELRDASRISLDDFAPGSFHESLLDVVDVVKVDLTKIPRIEWRQVALHLRGAGVTVCAKKVESPADFEATRELFDLFQGYYFQRPTVVEEYRPTTDRLVTMQLIAEFAKPDADIQDFVDIISRDPSLTFRMLQLANCASWSLPRRVDSVHSALVMLGLSNVRDIALMASLDRVEDKPAELLNNALIRAKTCELIAGRLGHAPAAGFTVGLLSLLEAINGVTLPEAMDQLNVTDDVRDALLFQSGPLGPVLTAAAAFERGIGLQDSDNVFENIAIESYRIALRWARDLQLAAHPEAGADLPPARRPVSLVVS